MGINKKSKNKNKKGTKNKTSKILDLKTKFLLTVFMVSGALISFNFVFQLITKPTEVISFLGFSSSKKPKQTWSTYKSLFQSHSTRVISSSFLAALAQVESSGNPLASPGWKFSLKRKWSRIFSPESTSVGLFQFTEGTYQQAKSYCIHNGKSIKSGPWYKWKSCWFNSLYTRLWPSHSIEMASSYLDYQIKKQLRGRNVSLVNKRRLAAIIHLCGPQKGKKFVRNGFRLKSIPKCGTHSVYRYIHNIENYEKRFRGFQLL